MSHSAMMRRACAAVALSFAAGAHAQPARTALDDFVRMAQANPPRPAPAPAIKPIPLSTGGSPQSAVWETMFGQTTLRNVTQPALYPVLPPAGKANGTAVVIAPGGAFLSLSFDSEGLLVARYLAERGVSCFVLAYRLEATPKDPREFMSAVSERADVVLGQRRAARAREARCFPARPAALRGRRARLRRCAAAWSSTTRRTRRATRA
jgi:hypothetical protein